MMYTCSAQALRPTSSSMNNPTESAPYFPPREAFGTRHDTLLGFRLGSSFASHAPAFACLAEDGFEKAPSQLEAGFHQFSLTRRTGDQVNACAYFLYDAEGALQKVALAFGGQPMGDAAQADVAATQLSEYLVEMLGAPNVVLHRIQAWAPDAADKGELEVAYAAAWGPTDADRAEVFDADDFALAVSEMGCPCSTAKVYAYYGAVRALLTYALPGVE